MKRILIIDDNKSNLEMLGLVFREEGFETLLMEGPADIGKILTGFSPQIVLLDLMMGSANGADLCKQIKASHKFSGIKVLLMTASNAFNTLDVSATQADGHIAKPFDINEITSVVNALLQD
jgi:DNA-binding response OmpR family regulator